LNAIGGVDIPDQSAQSMSFAAGATATRRRFWIDIVKAKLLCSSHTTRVGHSPAAACRVSVDIDDDASDPHPDAINPRATTGPARVRALRIMFSVLRALRSDRPFLTAPDSH
jgi:hypothetical protein